MMIDRLNTACGAPITGEDSKRLRRALGLTQAQFGLLMGRGAAAVRRAERDEGADEAYLTAVRLYWFAAETVAALETCRAAMRGEAASIDFPIPPMPEKGR